MKTSFDAIIMGAGPAGSTAAILLARAGWKVALVEKQRFPRRKVCGECVAASNLPLLDALGIGPQFEAAAGPALRQVALMRGAQTIVADLPPASGTRHIWGRALGRETFDTLLAAEAGKAGAVVLQPWAIQSFGGPPGNHRCEVRAVDSAHTLTLQAPVLIAAHGSWESVPASRSKRHRDRRASDLFAFKANFSGATLADGLLPVISFDGGYGGMVVSDHGIVTLACCIRRDQLDACRRAAPGLRAGEAVEAMLKRECRGVAEALRHAQPDRVWLAAGPIAPGIRLRPDEHFFRIGNAAGEAHPLIGEGMSMAIQSAWLLCAQLLRPDRQRDSGESQALWQYKVGERYAAEWQRQFAPRLRLAAAFAQLAMRPKVASPVLALLSRWPSLLTQAARWGGKAHCAVSPATIAWLAAGAGSPARQNLRHLPRQDTLPSLSGRQVN